MNSFNPVKIGVIGVGHLGNFHVEQIKKLSGTRLIGIFDENGNRKKEMGEKHQVPVYGSMEKLLEDCDAVSIVTPTTTHHRIATQAMDKGCHVFIEKPITRTLSEARDLLKQAEEKNLTIQVGHIEQFNPAFLEINRMKLSPRFIECHRLAPFNPRGTDVPVVLDLMIHDIGIILSLVPEKVEHIHASGVKVVSDTADIANARVEFSNGCVANLTSSRISQKKMRKLRLFQQNTYVTADFLLGKVETYQIESEQRELKADEMSFQLEGKRKKYIVYRQPPIHGSNALRHELDHFIKSITGGTTPMVDGHHATEALELAIRIQKIINGNNRQ